MHKEEARICFLDTFYIMKHLSKSQIFHEILKHKSIEYNSNNSKR